MTADTDRLVVTCLVIVSCSVLIVLSGYQEAVLTAGVGLVGVVLGWWAPRNGKHPAPDPSQDTKQGAGIFAAQKWD